MAATVGVNEVAQFCQISPRRVQQLVKEGMPQVGHGQYILAACAQWYIGYLQSKVKDQGSGTSTNDYKDKRIQYLDLQTRNAEIDLQVKAGKLIDIEQTQVAVNEAMVIIATQMDGLGGRCAGVLSGMSDASEIRLYLLNETRRIREAAADRLSRMGIIGSGSKDTKASTRKNTRHLGKSKQNTSARKRRAGAVAKRKNTVHDRHSKSDQKSKVQNDSGSAIKPNGEDRQHT